MNKLLYERKFFSKDINGKKFLFQTEYAIISPAGIVTRYFIDAPIGHIPLRIVFVIPAAEDTGGEFWIYDLTGQTLEFIKQFKEFGVWRKSKNKYMLRSVLGE